VSEKDLRAIAPLALRQRQSGFMHEYFVQHDVEERRIRRVMNTPASRRQKHVASSVLPGHANSARHGRK